MELAGISSGVVVRIGSFGGGYWDQSGYRYEDVSGGKGKVGELVVALTVLSGMM